jgi:transglutaminase-like putative cysteine protease
MRPTLAATLAATLALLTLAPTLLAAPETADQESWHALYLRGAKSGWSHETVRHRGTGEAATVTTATETTIAMRRAGTKVEIFAGEEIEEDARGRIVSFRTRMKFGFAASVTSGKRLPDGTFEIREGLRRSKAELPEDVIGPVEAGRRLREAGLKPGTVVRVRLFVPGVPGHTTEAETRVEKRETVDVLGRPRELWRTVTTLSAMPKLPLRAWLDDQGVAHVQETPLPGVGKLRLVRTEKAIALTPGEPAEVFTTTLIRPDRPIAEPRKLKRAVYRLRGPDEGLKSVQGGVGQAVRLQDDGTLRVEIELPEFRVAGYERPYRGKEHAALLLPAPDLESDDPLVMQWTKDAIGDEKNPVIAARLISMLVRRRIENKSLGVAFASAAEVARHREGDCTEHAVLAAAMARAAGMPSRVVMGLVYLRPGGGLGGKTGVFGYHMWAEVYVGGEALGGWFAIDPAIGRMDATHIALRRSDLAEGHPLVDLALPMMGLIGDLRIEVLEPR